MFRGYQGGGKLFGANLQLHDGERLKPESRSAVDTTCAQVNQEPKKENKEASGTV